MDGPLGFVALTDADWYRYLAARTQVDEVNFWQPHGNQVFRAVRRGAPFFFKLRAPARAIAGFGFFERYESLPAWMAWECFGNLNGAPDFDQMVDRIVRLRGEGGPRNGDFPVGCIMIAAPVFFSPDDWVDPPADWPPTGIQRGKRYDLQVGEGRRVLHDCLARARRTHRYWNVEQVAEGTSRYGEPILVRPRLGQGLFSRAVREAYRGACAVTGEHSDPVLEAAHIRPYAEGGEHRIDNGLLLRRDLHRLYDLGYATVTPDLVFRVGERLREEFRNGRSYYRLDKTHIRVPEDVQCHPNRERLEWHHAHKFKG